ncbi:hypothetical protein HYE67_001008 [Fusarium culmorum]|uniref:Transcription factor n=1 Tax=Fusarium culmorum TaxID=5516 RepID=A0A7S8CYN8_FUSCU|nr:hypothetical protein HYE67_001008 [Fusarium culmorum]
MSPVQVLTRVAQESQERQEGLEPKHKACLSSKGSRPASPSAQVSSVTAKAQAQPQGQNPAQQGREGIVGHAQQLPEAPGVPTTSGFGNKAVKRSTKIGRHSVQGCWQHGTDKDQASEDQDQNQGTHAPDQRQLQIPHFGVGFGQGERQASVTDSPRQESVDSFTAQEPEEENPSSIDERLAQSSPGLERPGHPSLYYLGLPQNQNHLHHQHHRAQQYQGFTGDDPSISTHQQPQPLSFGQHQHQHHQPPACSSPPLHFSFPFPSPPASAPQPTSVFGLAPPPPPPPATPPRPPSRRRFQPTTSRRQQNLSHCRSNSNLSSSSSNGASANRRLLASRSPTSHSASGKTPRQRLAPLPPQPIDSTAPQDTPTAHHRHSPFLPSHPHPPAHSLSARSTLSALSTSSPSSPILGSISSSPALPSTFSPLSSSSSSYQTCSSAIYSPHINMSRSSRNPAPAAAGTGRQNEYFVPRDGIDREVISADICRYLGNDALVRPGHYENPQTGQAVQGYYITAYRNLTTAMIEDLKADSARWDSERRAQTSRNTSGGTIASRNVGVPPRHSSNSPVVQYRYSETHQSRQHHGPTEGPYATDPYARDSGFDGGPRYPGTGAPGYTGAAGSYSQSYGGSSSGFAGYAQAQQSPPPADARFSSTPAAAVMNTPYTAGQSPYVDVGTNQRPRGYDAYANQAAAAAAAAAQQQAYATSAPSQPGYPATAAYQYSGQAPPTGYTMQPQDPFYGRGAYSGGPDGQVLAPPAADVVTERATGTAPTVTTAPTAGKRMSLAWIDDLIDFALYCHADETMLHTFYTGTRR